MTNDVYRRLREIAEKRDKEYGKLVQKLLAIAFCEAGAKRVTDRATQGIDLEVVLDDDSRHAIEVKTTLDGTVTFGKKDIDGLVARRESDGYVPCFGLLGSQLLDDWIFARYFDGELRQSKSYSLTLLRAYRDPALQDAIRESFPAAVVQHTAAAIDGGQAALDERLRAYDCYRSA